jgi:hypothetical protein
MNWIFKYYLERNDPPLWSSGQSYCPQIQRSGFDSRCYQIFWKVVGLERCASWVQSRNCLEETIEAPMQEGENTAVGIRHTDRATSFIRKKLALTWPTTGGRSVGIVLLFCFYLSYASKPESCSETRTYWTSLAFVWNPDFFNRSWQNYIPVSQVVPKHCTVYLLKAVPGYQLFPPPYKA